MDRIKSLVITLNKQAIKLIKEESPYSAICRLDQALQVLKVNFASEYADLYWMTYSNYGLILKKHQKYEQALNCFLIASEYCPDDSIKLAECLLRACNLLSRLKNHKKALDLALKSLKILKFSENRMKIVAYQNAGAEYEHLNQKAEARSMYKSGYSFAKKLLGNKNSFALMFKKRFKELSNHKKCDSINVINAKVLRFEQISKTPDLKSYKYKNSRANGEESNINVITKKLNTSGRLKRMTPQLRTVQYKKNNLAEHTFLKRKNKKSKEKLDLDDLYMIDSLTNSPKHSSPFNLDSVQGMKTESNKLFN